MTEAEWSNASHPDTLLRAVRARATDRQLRLFAAACCRLLWEELPRDACREAILLAERYADDEVAAGDLDAALRALNRDIAPERGYRARLAQATAHLLRARSHLVASRTAALARTGLDHRLLPARQCECLRDIFPSPLQPPPRLRGRPDPTALALADEIYTSRAFNRLPALADALTTAGCESHALLTHLRAPLPHVRGCWALDCIRHQL